MTFVIKESDCWQTPESIFKLVREVFGGKIELDCATSDANPANALRTYTAERDFLTANDIKGVDNAFLNPPYSNPALFIQKFVNVPAKQKIGLFKEGVLHNQSTAHLIEGTASAVCLWRSPRIKFVNPQTGLSNSTPNFDCCVVYWGSDSDKFEEVFNSYGICFKL